MNQKIEMITGNKIKFFRPPYGVTTPGVAAATEELQLKTIGWNIRSLDAIQKNEIKITKRVTSQLKSGSVILFHDTNPGILNVLEQTILFCEKNGFKIVRADKLLNLEPYA